MKQKRPLRVCLVTEELSYGKGTGGIGGAFHELALTLRRAGHLVDIIYLREGEAEPLPLAAINYYDAHGIRLIDPDIGQYVWSPFSYEKRSYAIFRHLISLEETYDFIHFHDYRGLGFATLCAKSQGLGFAKTTLVVQVHGPTRWAMEANDYPLVHEDQLKVDYMERESIARADLLVSPSAYMVQWLKDQGWVLPPSDQVLVIQNICTHLIEVLGQRPIRSKPLPANEIIYFARHEERKGIIQFCDALDVVRDQLRNADVQVTFLGEFNVINGEQSALYLARRSRLWTFRIRIMPDCDRIAAGRYLTANDRSVIVIPSRIENSPYAVVEASVAGKPLICSSGGGTPELLDASLLPLLTCEMNRQGLAAKLGEAVGRGLPRARLAVAPEKTAQQWMNLHTAPPTLGKRAKRQSCQEARPTVTAAITHFERPAKVYDALMSLAAQTYPNLDLLIVDDGSSTPEALQALEGLTPLLKRLNARMIRQPNRYLGAARNLAVAERTSDYLLFLDDDDIALPNLVSTLVTAAEETGADIVNCLYLYMDETRRHEAHAHPEKFVEKVSHVVAGGPLAAVPFDNVFGGATALIRRSALDKLGGYSEDYGLGFEDFEFYARAAQSGMRIEVCPLPLLLYETGRPSMVSGTSRLRNWNRVVRSIELSKQPEAWNDLVSVVAGMRAMEHNRNFNEWWASQHPQSELLQRITNEDTGTPQYAMLMHEFATIENSPAYANALRILAAERTGASEFAGAAPMLMPPLAPRSVPVAEAAPELDGRLLGALVSLSAGQTDAAIEGFLAAWAHDAEQPVTTGHIRCLRAIVRHEGLTAERAARLLKVLELKAMELKDLRELIPVTFRLALTAHDAATAMRTFEQASIVDETTYLASNPSVKDGIVAGTARSGLDHWTKAGDSDDPGSFPLLRKLRLALQAELGVEVPIDSFRQYIGLLAQGSHDVGTRRPGLTTTGKAHTAPGGVSGLNGHATPQIPATQ